MEQHLLGVADKAKGFAAKLSLDEQGELIGLLHDLGKYSAQFQTYIQSAIGLIDEDKDDYVDAQDLKGKVDHSTAGAQLIWNELSRQGKFGLIVGQLLSLCIASHHSGLIDCISPGVAAPSIDKFTKRMGTREERSHFEEVQAKMDASIIARFHELIISPKLIDRIKSLILQIVQYDSGNELITRFKIGLLVRFLFSCLIDADRIDTADAEKPRAARQRQHGNYIEWTILIEKLEKKLAEFSDAEPIDKIRRNIAYHCRDAAQRDKGIFTLSVPTGGGKTLASLRFALHHTQQHKMERIIYIIPYTSIIDQNADVVRKILEPEGELRGSVVLEHHSNLTPEQQGSREKVLAENWDAPVIYTTMVQLLETLFGGGTRGARRMHQLANSVLVFDEIQTLPVNTVHMFCNAINFLVEHCSSTVVLCTATQPLLNSVDSSKGVLKFTKDSEIMRDVKQLFDDLERVKVFNQRKPGGWKVEEIAELALREVSESGSCLAIVNTKKSAQALFSLLRQTQGMRVFHLSTNMCPAHRKKILAEIRGLLEEKSPVLCVSTQLIEAGVDVDFGAVIRYTAGLDSIAQAAGRCNRNKRREVGHIHIVNPADENLDMLMDIRVGKEVTERLLDDQKSGAENFDGGMIAPQAMKRYFEYYFFARKDEMDYPVSREIGGRDDSLLNMLSTNQQAVADYAREYNSAPNIYLRQSFMTAAKAFKVIDAPTRGIIVPYDDEGKKLIGELCGAFEVEKQFNLLRRAQQFTVNVFPHQLEKLQKEKVLHEIQDGVDILYLADVRYYNEDFGLSLSPEGMMEVLCG
ncbi:CRISPR-associated helicase Cas3' [Nitrosomonas sp. sh817]|uniref:CRISPR-associated helicase Cas3' n=1 Tax=Nitrosomonas sp. sh817 TaxID=3070658 RepID=UPI0027DCDA8C|nr:CRISPR-associated helicase Cas3' [Nitrosomonas sp. sh817]WMJ09095.1 CRISPR-associated helicase Cas3' [Nitrosomonas sp. sh817]